MKNKETFKCWNCEETFPEKKFLIPRFPEKEGETVMLKKSWGFNNVCPDCFDYLFMEDEIRDKRRVANALFCSKYGVWA